jgi:peptide/nickel transport system ATP-binding protein
VVEHIADRVAVMYVGYLVEIASTEELFYNPKMPYTEALLAAIPKPDPRNRARPMRLPGDVPSPANPPSGCYFHPRCQYAQAVCKVERPPLRQVSPGHFAACHFADELKLRGVPRLDQAAALEKPSAEDAISSATHGRGGGANGANAT